MSVSVNGNKTTGHTTSRRSPPSMQSDFFLSLSLSSIQLFARLICLFVSPAALQVHSTDGNDKPISSTAALLPFLSLFLFLAHCCFSPVSIVCPQCANCSRRASRLETTLTAGRDSLSSLWPLLSMLFAPTYHQD